ncbi:MAG: hypothetical protein GYB33_02740 [Gammaproteobacteria bacterium]|nr:hypothetical protein [Gammaproteobacteria bacterium]
MTTSVAAGELCNLLSPGMSVFIPGAVGIPAVFVNAITANPISSRGVNFLTSIAPGIENPLVIDQLDASATVTGLFMQPLYSEAQRRGQYRTLPISYSSFCHYLQHQARLDLCVIQVSPPNQQGLCSLGPSVEFTPLAMRASRRTLALINRHIPFLADSVNYPLHSFTAVCEQGDSPLPQYQTDSDATTTAIACHIASLVADGSTLQTGIGKVPTALAGLLANHRNLRLHSGLLSDGLQQLHQAGALDPDFIHTACALGGSDRFYEWIASAEHLRVRGCEVTHHPATLAQLPKLVAVNSALEVDLFGQCNLEHAAGRALSGAGGAPDFARAARFSAEGLSIVALVSSYKSATRSRIVANLSAPGVASLGRNDVDMVITEHGIADLRCASIHERAKALINIAEPGLREKLHGDWHAIAARL